MGLAANVDGNFRINRGARLVEPLFAAEHRAGADQRLRPRAVFGETALDQQRIETKLARRGFSPVAFQAFSSGALQARSFSAFQARWVWMTLASA